MVRLLKKSLRIIYRAGDNLVMHDGVELAGYLSFLSLLALFPFLVLMVAGAGFMGQGEVGARFIELILIHLPHEAVVAIRPRIEEIMLGPPNGFVTLSILGAIWTSSSMVEGMRTVLNRAYHVGNPPTYLWRRAMSIVQLLLIMMIIMLLMTVIVFAPIVLEQVRLPMPGDVLDLWNQYFFYVSGFLLFVTVAALYYVLPNIKQSLLAVVPGAAVVVILWIAGAGAFTLYLSNVDQVNIIYGSLGGFIATLLFFFILNVIFIYGAEFNHLIIEALGARIEEKEHVAPEASGDIALTDHRHQPAAPDEK